MKSVGYSTFSINNYDSQKQCLICLQGPEQSLNNIIIDDVKLINEMHFLIKECSCECYSHHSCIEKWIESNSVCPICRGPISFPKSGIKEEIIQMPTNVINQPNEIIILENTKPNNYVFLRVVIIGFFCIVIIGLLNNN